MHSTADMDIIQISPLSAVDAHRDNKSSTGMYAEAPSMLKGIRVEGDHQNMGMLLGIVFTFALPASLY